MTPASHAMPAPLFYGTPVTRRKAGRPKGSKAQVVQDARALGVHHFAFVRSSILGPDLAEYKAAFGLDNLDAIEAGSEFKDPVAERVRALNYLETVLSVLPCATDRLESWFARSVVKCLRNMGISTLSDLVRFINVHGHRWSSTIKGFGAIFDPNLPSEVRRVWEAD